MTMIDSLFGEEGLLPIKFQKRALRSASEVRRTLFSVVREGDLDPDQIAEQMRLHRDELVHIRDEHQPPFDLAHHAGWLWLRERIDPMVESLKAQEHELIRSDPGLAAFNSVVIDVWETIISKLESGVDEFKAADEMLRMKTEELFDHEEAAA